MNNVKILIDFALECGEEVVPHDIMIVLIGYEKLPQHKKIDFLERIEKIFDRPDGNSKARKAYRNELASVRYPEAFLFGMKRLRQIQNRRQRIEKLNRQIEHEIVLCPSKHGKNWKRTLEEHNQICSKIWQEAKHEFSEKFHNVFDTCPITQDVIMTPRFTPCGHKFEAAALDEWLLSNDNCPVCRTIID